MNPIQLHIHMLRTGRMPRSVVPKSPLITLLEQLSPRARAQIRGLTVGEALGYMGSRQFRTAEQAYRWCKPKPTMYETESWPAESWRIKRFSATLHIEDLMDWAASCPTDQLAQCYPRLCRPVPRQIREREQSASDAAEEGMEPPPQG